MTRDDFIAAVETLGNTVDMARYLERLDDIFAHDVSQRALIEQQATQIAMADHAYQLLAEAHEQQAKEIAKLQELLARIAHNCEEDESDALLKMHIHTLAKQALKEHP